MSASARYVEPEPGEKRVRGPGLKKRRLGNICKIVVSNAVTIQSGGPLDIRKIDELASHGAAAVLDVVGEGAIIVLSLLL